MSRNDDADCSLRSTWRQDDTIDQYRIPLFSGLVDSRTKVLSQIMRSAFTGGNNRKSPSQGTSVNEKSLSQGTSVNENSSTSDDSPPSKPLSRLPKVNSAVTKKRQNVSQVIPKPPSDEVDRQIFPDADDVLRLPIDQQVKLMASRFDREKAREIQAKASLIGYSLGFSVRIAAVAAKGKSSVSDKPGGKRKRPAMGDDCEEDDTDLGKKIERLHAKYGEGGIRIDGFLRMLCFALVTKQKLFGQNVKR